MWALGLPGRKAGRRGEEGNRGAESGRGRGGAGRSLRPAPPRRHLFRLVWQSVLRLKSFNFSSVIFLVPEKKELTLPSSPRSLADLTKFKILL